jgi:hypothetical protein
VRYSGGTVLDVTDCRFAAEPTQGAPADNQAQYVPPFCGLFASKAAKIK